MTKRLLDIVVTHYNEPWEIVRPFFDVLNAQRSTDFTKFKVWIVQDGPAPTVIPNGYFNGSKIDYEWITIPHKGVAAARNAGMDMADSEWICFCDCDDVFASVYSLKMLFYILSPDQPYDLMWNAFYRNLLDAEDNLIKETEYNHVWIHNKYYRLSFLREHNIRFPEGIYMSEDSAFNNVVELEIGDGRIGTINTTEPLYCWVRRPGSITTDPNRYYKNIEGHFERNLWVLNEYRKRNHPRSGFVVARTVTDAYAFLTRYPVNDDFKRITERIKNDFWKDNGEEFESLTDEVKKLALQASEREAGTEGMDIPGKMSLEEWIEWLKK